MLSRAIKRVVVDNVNEMGGAFPYITAMLFANSSTYKNVSVRHDQRAFGTSNYNLKRSLLLAANLIFSYSAYPLYFLASLFALASLFSFVYGFVILLRVMISGSSVPGWANTIIIMTFYHSLVLFSLTVFGVYLTRLNQQMTHTKARYKIHEIK